MENVSRDEKGRFLKGNRRPALWIENQRKIMVGKNNPFYGKKHTEEVKKIIKEKRALQDMSYKIGTKHSRATKEKISISRRGKVTGKDNFNWKGGVTSENEKLRKLPRYKMWRIDVFERDNYTCQECGQRGGELNADHIKPFALYEELRLDLWNGRTLCKTCHLKTDTYGKRIYMKNNKIISLV